MTGQTGHADRTGHPDYDQAARELFHRRLAEVQADSSRTERDRTDWRNLLYYRGGAENQWIAWDGNRYITKPTSGEGAIPEWVPRASTNIFAKKIDGIAALLDQSQPAQEWSPSTDDDEDRAAAEVIDDALPVLRAESGYDDLRPIVNKAVALTDKVAVVVYFDADERHGTELIQAWRCLSPECGQMALPAEIEDAGQVCPSCGGPELEPAVDQAFNPIGAEYPIGRITCELVSGSELSLPPGSRHTHVPRLPYLLTHTRYARSEARRIFGDKVDQVAGSSRASSAMSGRQYADAMPALSSPSAASTLGTSGGKDDTVLIYRMWHDPITSKDGGHFPEGLYIAISEGGDLLEAGPLPLKDADGRPVKPLAIRTFAPVPFTAYGKPPADDLAPLQSQSNLTETLALMILMHHAAPQTWLSDTITVMGEIQNVPGAINRYKSHQPGDKPVTVPGSGFPEALKWWLERIDQKFEELSGLNAVLAGQRPAGEPTLGEVELLREQGLGSFKSPIDELVAFEIEVSKLLLHTARQSAWAPRFRRVRGENGEWEITQFTAAELVGSVDVKVDPVSAWPKSALVQQMRIEKAVQLGLLVPQQDPELQVKLLAKLDLAEMKPSIDVDRKQIAREIDRWKAATSPAEIAPPDLPVINLQMHAFYKAQFLKTEVAEAMKAQNPPVYQAMLAHVQQLQQAMMPPPMPADGGAAPQAGGASLEDAIASGALRPAGSGGAGIDQLMQQGVLRPAGQDTQPQGPTGPSMDELLEAGVMTPAPQDQAPPQAPGGIA